MSKKSLEKRVTKIERVSYGATVDIAKSWAQCPFNSPEMQKRLAEEAERQRLEKELSRIQNATNASGGETAE